jgi:hypothetical protein
MYGPLPDGYAIRVERRARRTRDAARCGVMNANTMPMSLTLSADEVEVLRTIVLEALGNLRDEVYKTDNYDLRTELKQREALVSGLLARLSG